MVEPHRASESDRTGRNGKNEPSEFKTVGSMLACVLAASFYRVPSILAPTYSELLDGFGADIPALTAFLLPRFGMFQIFSVLSVALFFLIPLMFREAVWWRRLFRIAIINLIVSFIFLLFSICVIGLPILSLGSVV